MKWVFILYLVTLGDAGVTGGVTGSSTKIFGNNYWDAYRICEIAGKKILRWQKVETDKEKYQGFYCLPAKENPQY